MQSRFPRILNQVLLIGLAAFCARNLPAWVDAAAANSAESSNVYLEPKLLTGEIYQSGRDRGNLLFTFNRTAAVTNTMLEALREYRLPDGTLAARGRVICNQSKPCVV